MNDIKSVENSKVFSKISVKNLDLQTPIKNFLKAMGEDSERAGIANTPKRFEEALRYLLSGYDRSFEEENSVFENNVNYKDIISLKNIDFFSMCEHHLLPFFGYAHVGYVPSDEGYLGISKLARVVDIYARRLQNQEILGFQIAEALMRHGKAKGVAVLIEARHFCAVARGVERKMSVMSTCGFYGNFENDEKLQQKFMELVRQREEI